MASCAVCNTTRSVLLTSSCRAFNSRSISTATSSTPSSAVSSASAVVNVRRQHRQPSSSSPSSRRASSSAATSLHLPPVPIATAPLALASSKTTSTSNTASATASNNSNQNNFILASTVALLAACSLNFVDAKTTTTETAAATTKLSTAINETGKSTATDHTTEFGSNTTTDSDAVDGGSGGGGGDGDSDSGGDGGLSLDAANAPATTSSKTQKKLDEEVRAYDDSITKDPYQVSKSAEQGVRWTMEDTFTVANGGHFAAVFDGHGGAGVSGMLRDHTHRLYSKALLQRHHEDNHRPVLDEIQVDDRNDFINNDGTNTKNRIPSIQTHVTAIRDALLRVERESLRHDHFEYQGSTAVAVIVHRGQDGERTLISANVGDSRAILCRGRKAIDLTRDHKPSDEREKARIQSMGEDVQWDPYGEIYRVKDLSLSRAIGDRFAKPVVSSEAEIECVSINDAEDEFFLLASDGLWDVMTSQEVVDFVFEMLECPTQSVKTKKGKIVLTPDFKKRKMARFVAHEALERGSADNVCVILVWLKRNE